MGAKKVLFIQRGPFTYSGILSLSAVLRANGYETDLLVTSLESDESLKRAVKGSGADVVGLTFMSPERGWAEETAVVVKSLLPSALVVVGGVHAILHPEDAVKMSCVDFVCNSEGERAIVNLMRFIEGGSVDGRGLKGIWLRGEDGGLIKNEVEDLTEDISQYIEDRELYYRHYPSIKSDAMRFFCASRGCPYRCSFCFNAEMRDKFKNKGRYIRFKDPEKLVSEIELDMEKGPFRFILFVDDLFTMSRKWLKEFVPLYRSRINIPYSCNTRVEFAKEEVFSLLAESGCERVCFGIETGNEELRLKLLNKRIKNDDIVRMAEMARQYGLKIHTFNIFGLPTETLDNSFETIELNAKIKADIVSSSIYVPFPGTELCTAAVEAGELDADYSFSDIPHSFHRASVLKAKGLQMQEEVHKVSYFAVKHPSLTPFIRSIIERDSQVVRFVAAPIFLLIFIISFFYRHKGDNNSLWDMVKFIFKHRHSY